MEATVVSFLPFAINEKKPGLIPEDYYLAPSDGKIPSVLIIPETVECPIYRGGEMAPFRSPVRAEDLAKDIVNCYNLSQWGSDTDCHPNLFWVMGKFSPSEILTKFKPEIEKAKLAHNRWCMKLVRFADDDWNKNHRHKTISDIQRYAAKNLGLTNKEWFSEPIPEVLAECPSCTSLIPARAKKCKVCGEFVISPVPVVENPKQPAAAK